MRDGYIELPTKPGFGVEFVHEAMAEHPYSPQNFLRLFARRAGNDEKAMAFMTEAKGELKFGVAGGSGVAAILGMR